MARFPMLREKANAQASTLSGGQQKLLEVARGLLLDPKLMLIDEPSIGLSPHPGPGGVRDPEGSARRGRDDPADRTECPPGAAISDYGLVLEQGQTRIEDTAANVLADPRIARLFLGGGLAPVAEARP